MTSIDELANVIRDRFPSASVALKHFPSGSASLDIVFHEKLSVLHHRLGEGCGLVTFRTTRDF